LVGWHHYVVMLLGRTSVLTGRFPTFLAAVQVQQQYAASLQQHCTGGLQQLGSVLVPKQQQGLGEGCA
jgi:hypothetical protein